MVCSHKPQEATLQGFLCQNPQVPYFGGLRNRKLLAATAWQSYSNLKHISTNSNVRPDQFLQLSQTASLFEQWNKLGNQNPLRGPWLATVCPRAMTSKALWFHFWYSWLLPVILPALNVVRPPLTWMCIKGIAFGKSKSNLCSIGDKTYMHIGMSLHTWELYVAMFGSCYKLRVTSRPKWQFQRLKQPTFWILRGANITSLTYHPPRGNPSLTCFPAPATTEKNELIISIAFVYFALFSWFQTTHCGWPAFNDQLCGPPLATEWRSWNCRATGVVCSTSFDSV